MKATTQQRFQPLTMAAIALALGSPSLLAQEQTTAKMENVQVIAKRVVKRNHVNSPSPKLVYDADFFQRCW